MNDFGMVIASTLFANSSMLYDLNVMLEMMIGKYRAIKPRHIDHSAKTGG